MSSLVTSADLSTVALQCEHGYGCGMWKYLNMGIWGSQRQTTVYLHKTWWQAYRILLFFSLGVLMTRYLDFRLFRVVDGSRSHLKLFSHRTLICHVCPYRVSYSVNGRIHFILIILLYCITYCSLYYLC